MAESYKAHDSWYLIHLLFKQEVSIILVLTVRRQFDRGVERFANRWFSQGTEHMSSKHLYTIRDNFS